ncbi:sulfurtransferase TusA family protein [Halorussus sp. MSC15.2]|uniref:sulfurtransferase TusA family protein n=1 Tax=Halorussus sp. MSC15.2 TaxID=2283638 RepID=UPI0013D0F673|nr:sulfurtransferase TusA family protein [Halorussus sp. MSC15.2]NEU58694.1 sulfurtransferase TusA family protein [Halorussus sp. MSC15.2]
MNTEYDTAETLDVKGQNCPMPVVKTKQTIDDLSAGDILEVLATDPGSMSDIKGWAETTNGVALIDQVEDSDVYKHYVQKED